VADLADIRAGIAANLSASFSDAQITGYNLANALAPAFEVELDRIVYDGGMSRGLDEWFFTIRGFATSGTDKASQMRLDPWLTSTGAQSVKTALESDRTLGGTVADSHVTQVGRVQVFSPVASPGTNFYGAEWTLRVLAAGD
jgi:hypothetical protein